MNHKIHLAIIPLLLASQNAQANTIHYEDLEKIFGEKITISATGKPQKLSDVSLEMEILSEEEIRRSGARDIPDLLKRIPGVNVYRNMIGDANVAIRGYNEPLANRVLVLVNGKPIYRDSFGYVTWSLLPIQVEEIHQIEVVKGPLSSIYGFNAESGVINIVTHIPQGHDINKVSLEYGTQQRRKVSAILSHQFNKKNVFRLSYGFQSQDGFNRSDYEYLPASTNDVLIQGSDNASANRNYNFDFMSQLNKRSTLRFQSSFSNGIYDLINPFNDTSRFKHKTFYNHLEYQKDTINHGLWSFSALNSHEQVNALTSYNSWNVDASNLLDLTNEHTLKSSLHYKYTSAEEGGFYQDGMIGHSVYSGSLMWNWKPQNRKWSTTNAIRYDYLDGFHDGTTSSNPIATSVLDSKQVAKYSYNHSTIYKHDENDIFKFNIAKGYHIPSVAELGLSFFNPQGGFLVYGDANLVPESLTSISLGHEHKFEDKSKIKTTVFAQKYENIVQEDALDAPSNDTTWSQVGNSSSLGLELSYSSNYKGIAWQTGYTHMYVQDEPNAGSFLGYEGNARHQISLVGSYNHNKWEYDGDLYWISESRPRIDTYNSGIFAQDVKDYFILNLRAGYNYTDKTNIALIGQNLIEEHLETLNGPNNDNQGSRGGNTIGRSLLLNLTHKF